MEDSVETKLSAAANPGKADRVEQGFAGGKV
jgi:hypothetical protein